MLLKLRRRSQLIPALRFASASVLFWSASLDASFILQKPNSACSTQAGGTQGGAATFRLVRSVSGTKGSERQGRYIIEDPRTVFSTISDRKVIVYFEWEGETGHHHFEGLWKTPEGKVTGISEFDYEAKQRIFGAYWSFTIVDDMMTGQWTLEAHIDGQLAGTHTIEILGTTMPPPKVPERRPLSPSEVYKLAVGATVNVVKRGPDHQIVGTGLGVFVQPDLILTAFDTIDGANVLEVGWPDGKTLQTENVASWNRLQDWALIKVAPTVNPGVKIAAPESLAVGDEYFSLQVSPGRTLSMVAGTVTGLHDFPALGRRLQLSQSVRSESSGAPILNQFGDVVGVMTYGSLLPGSWSLRNLRTGYPANLISEGSPYSLENVLAVPVDLVRVPTEGAPPESLNDMARLGQFIPPLGGFRSVWFGTLARRLKKTRVDFEPEDSQFEYSHGDESISVYVKWNGNEKIKSEVSFRVFNMDNQLVVDSPPHKFNLSSDGRSVSTTWKCDINKLSPGLYRTDVILGQTPAWRSYFRIVR